MPVIKLFELNTNDLTGKATNRRFSIQGQAGAEFILEVVNNSGAFYNWKTSTFSAGHTPESVLRKKLISNKYNGVISFPASTSATYNVVLIAPPDTDTFIGETISTGGRNVVNKSITQKGDTTVTFRAATANGSSYGDPTDPTAAEDPPAPDVTSTGSPVISSNKIPVSNTWNLYNKKSTGEGFGLRLTRDPIDTDWYFQTTNTVNGAVSSGKAITLDGLTDIAVGMYITGVSSGSLSGTPVITEIDTSTNRIAIDSAQTFADGITLTFQARGFTSIKKAIGLDAVFVSATAKSLALEKTVRAGATSASIAVTDTYGISGGSHVTVEGFNINTSGTNNINTVTQDFDGSDTDGVIVMDLSSTVATGQKLYFTGSTTRVTTQWALAIIRYPSSNRIINLNLDNFITPGTDGT